MILDGVNLADLDRRRLEIKAMKDKDAQLMMEALRAKDVVKEDDYVPPHDEDKLKRARQRGYDDDSGPLDRVANVVIDKLGDITDYSSSADYSVSDLIDVTIEDMLSQIGDDLSAEHELNQPDVNSKVKDLIIRNLSDDRSHLMQGYER
jgi:hypothetical protein